MELKYSKRKQTIRYSRNKGGQITFNLPESILQGQCEGYLDALGIAYVRIPDNVLRTIRNSKYHKAKKEVSKYLTGLPDLIVLRNNGTFCCCELKSKYGKQTLGQQQFERKVRGHYHIVRSFEQFRKVLEE